MLEIQSERLYYKELTEDDVTENYVSWLNHPNINRYLELRHQVHTLESCRDFVVRMATSETDYLFGIFLNTEKKHIGNIKIGFINQDHKTAQLGLLIGDTNFWGQGFASEAIQTMTKWCFDSLGLQKLEAGCYEDNMGSLRAFLKSGYQVEGFLRSHVLLKGRRTGNFCLGVLPCEVN
ncbi:GNAT family N-acetyltransferase [Limnospira fusiformis]|uniref:GNAT family N-acetyltransferase n=1 Tax=Limnospira fusiformis TaxID=54297 RepID=UPI0034E0B132